MSTLEWLNRKELNQSFYQKSIEKYTPYDVKSLHWNSEESQMKRFSSLNRLGNLNNSRILDIGCGTGDLLKFLMNEKIKPFFYFGIDLIPDFIQVAKEKHPNGHFICADYFETEIPFEFDYAICNGALNIKEPDNYKLLKQALLKTYKLVHKGIGITLLKYSPFYLQDKSIFHYDEQRVLLLLKEMNFKHELHSDYADNDFTVFIYKS